MSNANEENNENKDIFMNDENGGAPYDNFGGGNIYDETSSSEAFEVEPPDPFAVENEVGVSDASDDSFASHFSNVEPESSVAEKVEKKGKKGKKAKAPKAKKEKVAKVKKEKASKNNDATYGSAKPFFALGALFLLGIVAGNAAAVMSDGGASVFFLAGFNVLGLVLLLIPALLIKQLKKRAVGLFDVFLALCAAFLTIASMAALAQQAQNYGASSKVASTVAVSSFADRA